MTNIRPFSLKISDEEINRIRQRVTEYPWHEMPDDGGWRYGANLPYMQEFCTYWVNEYDWRQHEDKINRLPHFKAKVDDIDLHFIYEKGSGDHPIPLIISHGWPGSVVEFLKIIEPLAHPERFGGNIEDAFDVIAPSLPGFGFSGRPSRPYGPRKIASVFNTLMTDVLGHDYYLTQGGDWGRRILSPEGKRVEGSAAAVLFPTGLLS